MCTSDKPVGMSTIIESSLILNLEYNMMLCTLYIEREILCMQIVSLQPLCVTV